MCSDADVVVELDGIGATTGGDVMPPEDEGTVKGAWDIASGRPGTTFDFLVGFWGSGVLALFRLRPLEESLDARLLTGVAAAEEAVVFGEEATASVEEEAPALVVVAVVAGSIV